MNINKSDFLKMNINTCDRVLPGKLFEGDPPMLWEDWQESSTLGLLMVSKPYCRAILTHIHTRFITTQADLKELRNKKLMC